MWVNRRESVGDEARHNGVNRVEENSDNLRGWKWGLSEGRWKW